TLRAAGIGTAGAGLRAGQAAAPAVLESPGKGRVLVFAFGSPTSGIPPAWAATRQRPGVNFLPDLSNRAVREIAALIARQARAGDVVVCSIHWGGNWGYRIPGEQIDFAHRLTDPARVHIVHGRSHHHVTALDTCRTRSTL